MTTATERRAIPREEALRLCEEIRAENRGKWWTVGGLWCLGCVKCSKTPEQRCWANAPGNRGCGQVNARYDRVARPPEK